MPGSPALPAALGGRDQSRFLTGQVHAGGAPEPEGASVAGDGLGPHLEPVLIEEDVARLDHRAPQVHVTVTAGLPVLPRPSAGGVLAVAVDPVHRREAAFLQP